MVSLITQGKPDCSLMDWNPIILWGDNLVLMEEDICEYPSK